MSRSSHPVFRVAQVNEEKVSALAETLTIPDVAARVLLARGIETEVQAARFLRKSMNDLTDPSHLHGMKDAVARLIKARQNQERVLVHGDFDADGITGAALLTLFLRHVGIQADAFLPDRLIEGHGVSPRTLPRAKEIGATLVVTCDCGSSSVAEIRRLSEASIDTIVTDHHELPEELPKGAILLNPKLSDGAFAQHDLSGVGVAFMLTVALRAALRDHGAFADFAEPNLKAYLDFVALGTLADMAPLTDQNRILVAWGLAQIGLSERPGIVALKEAAGIGAEWIRTDDVGFRLAPRINASARLGHANEALELLMTEDFKRAKELAKKMDGHNAERKALQSKMTRHASFDAERQVAQGRSSIVVSSREFHVGVIGLVAQNLTKMFSLPAFVFALDGEKMRGSARSAAGVDLLSAMNEVGDLFESFGGHREAGGGILPFARMDEFSKRFDDAVRRQSVAATRELRIDAELGLRHLNEGVLSALSQFRPFGIGNPEPVFLARAHVVGPPKMMGTDHLRVTLKDDDGRMFVGIGWGLWQSCGALFRNQVEVAYTPEENVWNGRKEIRLRVTAVRTV